MGSRLGRYEVIRTLVKGELTDLLLGRADGMEGFQRHAAIKRLKPHHAKDPRCVDAFVTEARLAAALHHHNIVQVVDIGTEAGQPYFAMEYVHGVDLRTLLGKLAKRGEQLPLQHVVSIVACAAAALHHAHEQKGPDGTPLGIVHRDVTPANILVGFDGNVKVVDFGIAKAAINRGQTDAGVFKGRAPYMAPEQCAGQEIDRRSDVFALGIVLYELATVRRLFKGGNDFLTMSAIVKAQIPKPSQYRRDVPPELEAIMLKALAREPRDRFPTAAEMSLELDKVATKVGVGASSSALASYMRLQFGDRKEPWLVDVDFDPETTAVDFDGLASGLAPPPPESVKNHAIPKIVKASHSSPIAQLRNATPALPSEPPPSNYSPVWKSSSPTPASLPPPPTLPASSTAKSSARAELPRPKTPSKPPDKSTAIAAASLPKSAAAKAPIDKSFSMATVVDPKPDLLIDVDADPDTAVGADPDLDVETEVDGKTPIRSVDDPKSALAPVKTDVASPPPPPSSASSPSKRSSQIPIDPTEIVVPLPVMPAERPVLEREQPTRKRTILLVAGALGLVVLVAGAIVLWPGADVSTPSAAPTAKHAAEKLAAENAVAENHAADKATASDPTLAESPGLQATSRDYEQAREDKAAAEDKGAAEAKAEEDAKSKVPAEEKTKADAEARAKAEAEAKALAEEKAKADAEKKQAAEDAALAKRAAELQAKADAELAKAEQASKARAAAKPAAKKPTAKTAAAKPAAKTVKRTTAKKPAKKPAKWNPDDLFLGD